MCPIFRSNFFIFYFWVRGSLFTWKLVSSALLVSHGNSINGTESFYISSVCLCMGVMRFCWISLAANLQSARLQTFLILFLFSFWTTKNGKVEIDRWNWISFLFNFPQFFLFLVSRINNCPKNNGRRPRVCLPTTFGREIFIFIFVCYFWIKCVWRGPCYRNWTFQKQRTQHSTVEHNTQSKNVSSVCCCKLLLSFQLNAQCVIVCNCLNFHRIFFLSFRFEFYGNLICCLLLLLLLMSTRYEPNSSKATNEMTWIADVLHL